MASSDPRPRLPAIKLSILNLQRGVGREGFSCPPRAGLGTSGEQLGGALQHRLHPQSLPCSSVETEAWVAGCCAPLQSPYFNQGLFLIFFLPSFTNLRLSARSRDPTVLQAEGGLSQEAGGGSFASTGDLHMSFENKPDLRAQPLRLSPLPSPFCPQSRGRRAPRRGHPCVQLARVQLQHGRGREGNEPLWEKIQNPRAW